MININKFSLAFLFCGLSATYISFWRISFAAAWSDQSHLLSGAITKLLLPEDDVAFIDYALQLWKDDHPDFNDIIRASCWADYARCATDFWLCKLPKVMDGLSFTGALHFEKRLFNPLSISSGLVGNSVSAAFPIKVVGPQYVLNSIVSAFKTSQRKIPISPVGLNLNLRFFLHIFQDFHQPLHVISLITPEIFYKTDQNGNFINLVGWFSLHQLWDQVAGDYRGLTYNCTDDEIKQEGAMLLNSYKYDDLKPLITGDLDGTHLEPILYDTVNRSLPIVYSEIDFSTPYGLAVSLNASEGYKAKVKNFCKLQIVIASYRLSNALKDLLPYIRAVVTHYGLASESMMAASSIITSSSRMPFQENEKSTNTARVPTTMAPPALRTEADQQFFYNDEDFISEENWKYISFFLIFVCVNLAALCWRLYLKGGSTSICNGMGLKIQSYMGCEAPSFPGKNSSDALHHLADASMTTQQLYKQSAPSNSVVTS